MNKFKSKRQLTIMVAVFAVVFLASSAFAFVSASPLVFEGTVNVNASLSMHIIHFEVEHSDGVSGARTTPYRPNNPDGNLVNPMFPPGIRSVDHYSVFSTPGDYIIWSFTVKNTGTVPTRIDSIEIVERWIDSNPTIGSFGIIGRTNVGQLIGTVVQPEDFVLLEVRFDWCPILFLESGFTGDMLDFYHGFTTTLEYGMAH
ncbi:MAG: hypothetical protein FWE29_00980 [Defluviitaleaceae bacterium]|nr:hypothetical protein [Defluviitaleaceae bacterium]